MNNWNSSRSIAVGGISVALIILSLFAGTLIQNSKLFFMALATFFGSLPCILNGSRGGVISYAAASILSLAILPNKLYTGVYILFGIYPVIKLLCERYTVAGEKIFKYLWFNLMSAVSFFIYKSLIFAGEFFKKPLGIVLLILILEIAFFVYDYAFTVFISFVKNKIFKEV